MKITNLTAQSMAKKIKAKELSPVDVVQSHLDQIKRVNPKLNLFITVFEEEALKEAKVAEEELMKKGVRGPLHGIPIALKDLTSVAGRRTTFGSPLFENHISDSEPTIVTRIRNSGAIIIGKTNTPEFGHKGTTDNLIAGPTKNPWDSSRTAGGSSGGSAAAVASKCVPIAEGSDGGGSIRIPSSLNGIVGHKPTFGRVPFDSSPLNRFGTIHPFVHYGPMARSTGDAALLLSVMEGYQPSDPFSIPLPKENLLEEMKLGVKGKRFAFTENFGLYPFEQEILGPLEEAISLLREQGAIVEKIPFQFGMNLKELITFFNKMWYAGLAAAYGALYDRFPSQFSQSVSAMIESGRQLSAVELRETEMKRTIIWNTLQQELDHYDAILSPVVGVTAFSHQIDGPNTISGKVATPISDWMMTQLYNCTGHPAISIPVGTAQSGLPVGLQAATGKFNDRLLFRIAHTLEREKGFHFPNI